MEWMDLLRGRRGSFLWVFGDVGFVVSIVGRVEYFGEQRTR